MKDLPNAIEAEQALLGAAMASNASLDPVPWLLPQHFHEPLHRALYAVILDLIAAGKTANPVTMKPFIPQQNVGELTAFQYAIRLAAEAVNFINVPDYAQAIFDAWKRRAVMGVCQDAIDAVTANGNPMDAEQAIAGIDERLSEIRTVRPSVAECGAGEEYLNDLNARHQRSGQQGVPMPFEEMARVLSEPSFEPGNLYGLLSSSGEGKTSLLLQILFHAAKRGHPVVYFSYDQSRAQIVRQLVSQNLDIEARRQKDWDGMSRTEIDAAINFARKFDRLPFHIHRATDEGIGRLGSVARRVLRPYKGGPSPLIALDHIMRVTLPDDMRKSNEGARAIAVTSPAKTIAEQCEAAFLMVNQRNSTGVRRFNPRPTLADLYGGEPARYDYDTILGLFRRKKWRDERLKIAEDEKEVAKIHKLFPVYPGEPDDVAELSALKVRYGDPSVREVLEFEARFTRYRSMQVRGNMFDD